MDRFLTSFLLVSFSCLLLTGCPNNKTAVEKKPAEQKRVVNHGPPKASRDSNEPTHITVQHALIAFDGSLKGKSVGRTKDEASELAAEVFKKAKAGEDFDALVKEMTNDSYPGIYKLANDGEWIFLESKDTSLWVRPRIDMVPGFGNVSFGLKVDEVGMAEYDAESSPFGWHIIKRIR